jgi:hypothetical protein
LLFILPAKLNYVDPLQLLEERDTLQLKLSNVMRQFERQKESGSRASTACSTPIPWNDNTIEINDLRIK